MAIPDVSGRSLNELISLAGRNAVVTGGARGIGYAISRRLAEGGAAVVIADLNAAGAEAAATKIADGGRKAKSAFVDVRDSKAIVALVDKAVRELGSIDIWLNNAGIFPSTPLLEVTDAEWDHVLN